MPSISQSYSVSIAASQALPTPFSKSVVWNHDEKIDLTLTPGNPVTITPPPIFAAGSFMLVAVSDPTLANNPYTPAPFTVSINNGVALQVDDLLVLNLSAMPASITFGLPAGANANVNVHLVMAGQ